jgi:hypothetical protein
MRDIPPEIEEEGRRIDAVVQRIPDQIQTASWAALEAHMSFTTLQQLYDVDLFDGQEGLDALHELAAAMRHLRNARRIAEHRAHLYDDEQEGETDG